jgi:hypothetical protein
VISTEEGDVRVNAPMDGVVQKMFYNPEDTIEVGWTLVDLKVSRDVMHHGAEEETDHDETVSLRKPSKKGGKR